ncbi:MAG: sodium:solute symporter family protein [Acidobacteria bacterium]|nr:sodium:solute symporter family protein [Acidobacteriota bacterium]
MSDVLPFGVGAWFFVALYLCSLLLIGWIGYNARREDTLRDFYLAGRGFGFVVLFLTLYATQYSGNTVFGVAGAAYREGFGWLIAVHYMLAIVVCYLIVAPKLYALSRRSGYVTPVDFVQERFGSGALSLLASIVMIVALNNYLLAQLMTMGRVLQGFAGPYGDIAYNYGVLGLTLVMVVYGTMGGIRAVAWTDVLQGGVLMVGFAVLLALLCAEFGPLSEATSTIAASANVQRIAPPDADMQRQWLSYILIVGLGGALYPHAIQRIYASRSARVLSRSLAVMVFLPFATALIAVVGGIYALAYIPGLEGAETDQVLSRLLRVIQESSAVGYGLVVLIFSAVLAALMSTADSAMLSISSMFTKDIYAVHLRPDAPEAGLTRKRCAWFVLGGLAVLAIVLKEQTSLITLLDRKFDLLVQLVPAFMLGIHWSGLKAGPTLAGLVAGLIVALSLAFGPFDAVVAGKAWGFHPGLYGLVVNVALAVVGSLVPTRELTPAPSRAG